MTSTVNLMSEPRKEADDALASWILGETFSCLGARAALRKNLLHEAAIGRDIGDSRAAEPLYRALLEFIHIITDPGSDFASLVAVFTGPFDRSEDEFEILLWRQLDALRTIDRARGHEWATSVDSDPGSPRFAFSAAGHPFFVVGMHPGSSRISRRFHYPALAFNSHHQFRRLKSQGTYAGLQRRIRHREMCLQGSINSNLAEHGEISEALQYSGKANSLAWECPVEWSSSANINEQESRQ